MAKQDYLLKLSILQQEAGKIEEQLQLVNQQIAEFEILKMSLEKISKSGREEILAPVGKGVYLRTKPLENELFVNIGANIVLKKTPKEAEKIIDSQINELGKLKEDLVGNIEKINLQLQNLVEEAQKEQAK